MEERERKEKTLHFEASGLGRLAAYGVRSSIHKRETEGE